MLKRPDSTRVVQLILLCSLLLALEFVPRLFPLRTYAIWVPLSEMLAALGKAMSTGEFTSHLAFTTSAVLLAFAAAMIVGVPCGIWIGAHKTTKRILDPYMVAFYAIPFFAVYPALVTILGFGLLPIVLTSMLGGLIGVIINTALGIERAIERYAKIAHSFRLRPQEAYRKVYVPAAMPNVFTGASLGFVYAFLGVIGTEFILSDQGLGHMIKASYETFQVSRMLGGVLFVLLLGASVTLALEYLEKVFYRRMSGG
jgi:ABC-type nitrate/sulfonate/bicarbonate transport system permease component